jgi:4-hydroxy-tetrahydrodipicolinate reductase
MNILLNGISGFMGREVEKLCKASYRGASLLMGVDPMADKNSGAMVYNSFDEIESTSGVDCIIDFSHHTCTPELLKFAVQSNIPTVVCTTGHTEEELSDIKAASEKIPVFFAANMSLGVALLVELAKKAAAAMPEADIEIIEKHHNRKLDAPSGTALMIADAICNVREGAYTKLGRAGQAKRTKEEIGIHAIRMGNIVGEHEVIIGTENQTITLKHEAHSRALFAEGAIAAADFLYTKPAGLYDMNSLVGREEKATVSV